MTTTMTAIDFTISGIGPRRRPMSQTQTPTTRHTNRMWPSGVAKKALSVPMWFFSA